MSETLAQPKPPESIDPALAAEWFTVADQIAPFNQQTIINRGNGPEEFTLHDVVGKQVRDEAGNRVDSIPTVVLARKDGTTEDFGVADFLTYVGADSFGLRHIIDEAKAGASIDTELSDSNLENTVERWSKAVYAGETAVHAAVEIDPEADVTNYDYLFAPDAPVAADTNSLPEVIATVEKDPRLEVLFAPKLTVQEFRNANPAELQSYDHLFMEDGPERGAIIAEQANQSMKRHMEEQKYTTTTEESKSNANLQIAQTRSKDHFIDGVLRRFEQDNPKVTSLVDSIRTNADLRYTLGEYLLKNKLPRLLHKMPNQIYDDVQKRPAFRGYSEYRDLKSREYASMLALSMLDGTFMGTPKGDEIKRNPTSGIIIGGQHRFAALELLS